MGTSKLAGVMTAVPEAIRPTRHLSAAPRHEGPRDRDVLRRHGGRRGRRRPDAREPDRDAGRSAERFGAVVPEVASRARVEALNPLLGEALDRGDSATSMGSP
jgi:hypothetical protein